MANRTVKYANSVHGVNPQYLVEKIIRERIYDSRYWQEDCFLLTSALVLERAVDDLKYIGGAYGAKIDPTPFLCLVLKLLQIQPEKEIIYLYIEQPDFKYLRALGAFYLRLTGRPVEVYNKLEPLYNDYRKLRVMDNQRRFSVIHMDEFIDSLLRDEKVLNITIPRITKRYVLEENRDLEPYKSELEELNLIPTQLIEEEVEEERRASKRDSHHNYRERPHRDRHGHSGRQESSSRSHHSSYRERGHDHNDRRDHRRRMRSKSPSRDDEKPSMSKYAGNKNRFSQAEIDNENAIRAKLGLRPLH